MRNSMPAPGSKYMRRRFDSFDHAWRSRLTRLQIRYYRPQWLREASEPHLPALLSTFANLHNLNMYNSDLSHSLLTTLATCTHLRTVNINRAHSLAVLPSFSLPLTAWPSLQQHFFFMVDIAPIIVQITHSCPGVRTLCLTTAASDAAALRLTRALRAFISTRGAGLTHLNMNAVPAFTDTVLRVLAESAPNLEELMLTNFANLTGKGKGGLC
ncbi:hypothetical protein BC938DRAFT_474101 [Jimgerdemannia flammicorona]|uniref:F-box domain-containing protein n=1 Tax=Jimgerdemannia flammicorona TaxID=994334 RepID=A0A433Q2S2_9FUNG|nr:hypothetical protein BC938DRAFT_474101 [Jimgerdemannia flammicorona]